jgi:4-hydroxyphenylpyruvate dioxygenase-like putative hemolysin
MLFQNIGVESGAMLKSAVRRIDHVTYVTGPGNEAAFIASWNALGFRERNRLHTKRYPAAHIVLADEGSGTDPWQTMTGLSVSSDPQSPVNEFVNRYGTGVQHVAYIIRADVDMDDLYVSLKNRGWNFLTQPLSYIDANQAKMRQIFVAPTVPYGPFVELVQRLPGVDGKTYDDFDVSNIDSLYAAYDEFSRQMLSSG